MSTKAEGKTVSATRAISIGVGAGVIASVVMGMYAMTASLLKDTGFFTPLHHIATLLANPGDLMSSMMSANQGEGAFEVSVGTAILGLVIHMMTGAAYGVLFAVAVNQLKLRGAGVLAGLGVAWGAIVFAVSSWIALPLASAIFGVGDFAEGPMAGKNPVADMPEMAGWGVFVSEHLLFGLVVGLIALVGLRKKA